MKSALKYTALVIVVLAGTFVGGGYLLPSKVTMNAWKTVVAPHDHMSALVATPTSWTQWSALASLEKYAKRNEVSGTNTGVGASWTLANDKGSIQASITAFEPAARVSYDLLIDRLKIPIKGTVDFYNRGRTTKVKWSLKADVGKNLGLRWLGFIAKSLVKSSYQDALGRLGVIAAERAYEESQDALAAEEARLIGKQAKDD